MEPIPHQRLGIQDGELVLFVKAPSAWMRAVTVPSGGRRPPAYALP